MKILVCVTIAIAFAAVDAKKFDSKPTLPPSMKMTIECGNELSIDMSSVETGGIYALRKIKKENKDKCLAKCEMTKKGMIDESGNLLPKEAEKSLLKYHESIDMSKVKECFDKFNNTADCSKYPNIEVCILRINHEGYVGY